jgi:SAM-dependent methyltransferase
MAAADGLIGALEADGVTPTSNSSYTSRAYWDARFAVEESKDWLAGYSGVSAALDTALGPGRAAARARRVLLVGTGNSALPADMAADGYASVLATDYSSVVVESMRARVGACGGRVAWAVEDMRALTLADGAVDAVVDKAALDALLADGGDVWNAAADAPQLLAAARAVVDEAHRVLSPGGVYVCITFSQPHFRKQYLVQGAWAAKGAQLRRLPIDCGLGYTLFYLVKGGGG